jgi:hypothetical protein
MLIYIFQADIYCQGCGEALRAEIAKPEGFDVDNESSFDSDVYPKGPYGQSGGEADSPQHCGACGLFLENPLTPDGRAEVERMCDPYTVGRPDTAELAKRLRSGGYPIKAEWVEFYDIDLSGEESA